jgi:polysaccharide export outer membrane protein
MEGKMKKLIVLVLFYVFSVSSVFAAQSTDDVPASAEMKKAARAEILGAGERNIVPQEEYVIGQGDVLSVSVYGEGDMAVSAGSGMARTEQSPDAPRFGGNGVRVMMDGRISLMHIGDVEVVGMTLTELADYLKKLYATIYDAPIVTTALVQSNSLRYTVMGKVVNPGIFFLDYPLTLVQAVARSGGFTEWAKNVITVVREQVKERDAHLFQRNTLEFDYNDFVSGKGLESNIFIQSGDIIIVD